MKASGVCDEDNYCNDTSVTVCYSWLSGVNVMPVSSAAPTAKRETLNLRIKADDRGRIDRAAAALGKNRTEFVLDAARQAANETLLDQTHIKVSADHFERYITLLDAKPQPNERLKRTLRTAPPWERP
jgi:uncharacterized protein (DUF1778 family)